MFVWDVGDLNSEQEAAVLEEGSVFLVACPGSGKTRTVTYKIACELSKLQSDKQWVIAITYTHRAADEIHERVENLGVDTSRLWIGTIHSFCLEWILKPYAIYHEALKNGFSVINSYDTDRILTELCQSYRKHKILPYDCGYYYTSTGRVLTCAPKKQPYVREILDEYHTFLLANRQIDFELILRCAYELVFQNPSISVLLGSLFSCVLVDEYQDTKEIQYVIIASILKASEGKAITFIVGDPNQAIYGSLGGYAITADQFNAMAEITLKEMSLSLNYRSTNRLISYFGNYNVSSSVISSAAKHKEYLSIISFDQLTSRDDIEAELVRLIRYNIETVAIPPHEVCVLAPWWTQLASMTRKLIVAMPEYSFNGPGMIPFAGDIDNFWYRLSKIILTEASPHLYVRRVRWARDILIALGDAGIDISKYSSKSLLRDCNTIVIVEEDGLNYLKQFFESLFIRIGIDFRSVPTLFEHYNAFFENSQTRIERLKKEGSAFIGKISAFRKVFAERNGITVSTIHGVKGAEYDTVIAFALLEGMVPHFASLDGYEDSKRLLYVICSRARKNLHLISERDRINGRGIGYTPTDVLVNCHFNYDEVP